VTLQHLARPGDDVVIVLVAHAAWHPVGKPQQHSKGPTEQQQDDQDPAERGGPAREEEVDAEHEHRDG
jgi:hypothetical protein